MKNEFKEALIEQTIKSMGRDRNTVEQDFRRMNEEIQGKWKSPGSTARFYSGDKYEFHHGVSSVNGTYQVIGGNLFLSDDKSKEFAATYEIAPTGNKDKLILVRGGIPWEFYRV